MLSFPRILFIFIIAFLSLSLFQRSFPLFHEKPLDGTYVLSDDTNFSFNGWFSGKYQAHREKYLNDHFEFRSAFIRCRNQVDFSLYHQFHTQDVVEGKNHFLFNTWYIDSYKGLDFIGSRKIIDKVSKLKILQDTLAKHNKVLLVVFSPSKDLYAPENLPEGIQKGDSTNYALFEKTAKEKGLIHIDFENYFIKLKQTVQYPLFPAYGSHWSYYGACVAGDSIISALEGLSKTKIPHYPWRNSVLVSKAEGDELELSNEINIFSGFPKETLAHPLIKDTINPKQKRPSVLIIGDSYILNLEAHYNLMSSFSSYKFCYYFKTVYTLGTDKSIDASNLDLHDAIDKADMIIVESTEINLGKIGWGFTEAACKAFGIDSNQSKIN